MPCVVPSHQAPVLPLKQWRPELFSGLGLCLGTMVPDLAFILRVDNDSIFSHTLAAQFYFTIPVSLMLYLLVVSVALPFWLPRLPDGPPWHFDELRALRLPHELSGWARVAISSFVGGLTHVFLDAVTHGNHSGWLVPYLPFLRTPVGLAGRLPLHDVLQLVLSLWFAVSACLSWRQIARERLLWKWRGASPQLLVPRELSRSKPAVSWLMGCAGTGLLLGPVIRGVASPAAAIEIAAIGALAFALYGFLAIPALERLVKLAARPPAVRPA